MKRDSRFESVFWSVVAMLLVLGVSGLAACRGDGNKVDVGDVTIGSESDGEAAETPAD